MREKDVAVGRQWVAPLVLGVAAATCVGVAAATGRPAWAAAAGAGLTLVYWSLEALAWRRGAQVEFRAALAVALGGMVLRLATVVGALVVIALVERAAFATAALSFLAAFTVYMGLRLFTSPVAASGRRGEVRPS